MSFIIDPPNNGGTRIETILLPRNYDPQEKTARGECGREFLNERTQTKSA